MGAVKGWPPAGSKVAVIGDRESVLLFKAAGVRVYPVKEIHEAEQAFDDLVRSDYVVIFITEELAEKISHRLQEYALKPLPVVVPIPNIRGSVGYGFDRVRDTVKKAVGADILKHKEG